jgi:Gamma-glutamyl cyclotransferase, AIG2-like
MAQPAVWVFFYGSYINRKVLAEVDIVPGSMESAVLPGHELVIRPLANLVPSDRHVAHGILIQATHAELDRLYTEHAQGVLGGTYLPQAVVCHLPSGDLRPALAYIAHDMPPRPADPAYVRRILQPAREYGFPDWYLAHIRAFAPGQ